MTDSTGITHRPIVKDMLIKTYNFMVNHKFDVTNPVQVYRAEVQTMGYHPSDKYCQKFVNELEFIKHVAENQPVTTVTYKRRMWNEDERIWIDLSGVETEVLKTYDLQKTDWFKAEWNNKDKSYVIVEIVTINEINLEYNK